jgi:hypothetical protein
MEVVTEAYVPTVKVDINPFARKRRARFVTHETCWSLAQE